MNSRILSVSIAAYNVEKTLEEALYPFTKNDVKDLVEVLIVDDGSKDKTAELAKKYEQQYPGTFRLISKENGGWGSTLNAGIQKAVGKYFKQLDGDDTFSEENLPAFLKFLQTVDSDMVYTPFITYDDSTHGIINLIGSYYGSYAMFPMEQTISLDECTDFMPAMHCLTIRTDILRQNNITITEKCFYTDVEYVLKSYAVCNTITFYEQPIYYYRLARAGQSMSLQGVRKHYTDHQTMLKNMLAFFEENFQSQGTYLAKNPGKMPTDQRAFMIEQRLLGACNMQYLFYFALKYSAKHKKEAVAFDTFLKTNHPDFYNQIKGNQITFLRKTHFVGYRLVAYQKMRKDRRLKQNLFEGA